MAIVWTEADDRRMDAMQYLKKETGCAVGVVSEGARYVVLKFDVIDPDKANSFLIR